MRRSGLSDIWVDAKRAPEAVARQVAALPEVAEVESRVQAFAKLKLPGFDEPVSAQMIPCRMTVGNH